MSKSVLFLKNDNIYSVSKTNTLQQATIEAIQLAKKNEHKITFRFDGILITVSGNDNFAEVSNQYYRIRGLNLPYIFMPKKSDELDTTGLLAAYMASKMKTLAKWGDTDNWQDQLLEAVQDTERDMANVLRFIRHAESHIEDGAYTFEEAILYGFSNSPIDKYSAVVLLTKIWRHGDRFKVWFDQKIKEREVDTI